MPIEKVPVSVPSLIERGNNFLAEEQFDQAFNYFNKALDADAQNVEAYWGALMAEHQCKDELTLLSRGIPIDQDKNYGYVLKYADEKRRTYYQAICEVLHFTCHLRFMETARQGNTFIMKKWAKHYADNVPDGPFAFYHDVFIKIGGLQTIEPELPGALLGLYAAYDRPIVSVAGDQLADAQEKLRADAKALIVKDYTARMNQLFEAAKTTTSADTLLAAGAQWAVPTATFNRTYNVTVDVPFGLDGRPNDMPSRYILLIETLIKDGLDRRGMSAKKKIFTFLDVAQKYGYDAAVCADLREKLFLSIYNDAAAKEADIQFLADHHPNDHRPFWKLLVMKTNNFSAFGADNANDQTFNTFMSVKAGNRASYQEADIVKHLHNQKAEIRRYRADMLAAGQPLLQSAINAADGNAAADMNAKWNSYIAQLDRLTAERTARVENRLASAQAQIDSGNKGEKAKAKRNSVIGAILSLLIACTAIPCLLFALDKLNNPMSILKQYHVTWFYVIAIALAAVAGIVTFLIAVLIKPRARRFMGLSAMNAVRNFAPILCIIGYVGVIGVLIASAITFSGKIGTISIEKADDIAYLKRYTGGDFALAADIDFGGKKFSAIGTFSGTIDGQGHTLSHFTVDKGHMIDKNKGTIKNLTLSDFEAKDALFKKNSGELNALSIKNGTVNSTKKDNLKYDAFLTNENDDDGKIISCKIADSTYTFSYGEIEEGAIGGLVANNDGEIIASSVGLTMDGQFTMAAESGIPYLMIGTVSGESRIDGIIGCSSSSTLKLTISDELYDPDGISTEYPRASTFIGGLVGNGTAERSYFTGEIDVTATVPEGAENRTSYIDDYFYIGGVLGSGFAKNCYANCSIKAVFPDNGADYADTQEFVGGLVGYINAYAATSVENCYAKVDCTFEAHSGTYDYAPLIGYSRSEAKPAVKNAFNYGTEKIDKSKGTITYSGSMATEGVYYSKSMFPDDKNDTVLSNKKLKSKSFITKTLGWDTEIWKVTDGKLPTLKAYVVEEATDVADDKKEG